MSFITSLLAKLRLGRRSKFEESDAMSEVRNWYADRYQTTVVQRNIFFLIAILSLIGISISVIAIRQIALSKTVEPFVIEVERTSGITTVVNPKTLRTFNADETLKTYFLLKYISARETYHIATYNYNYFSVVQLMSSSKAYAPFRKFVRYDKRSPINRYRDVTWTTMEVRSVQELNPDLAPGKMQVRFSIQEHGARSAKYDKVAIVDFGFYQQELSKEERYTNPLGFQVLGYQVDNEVQYQVQ